MAHYITYRQDLKETTKTQIPIPVSAQDILTKSPSQNILSFTCESKHTTVYAV